MAVYTEVSDVEMADFVRDQYDIGELVSAKGIAEGVENSNYLIRTSVDTYILTLYEKRVPPEDLPFFIGLMDHMAKKDFPAPRPIHGRDGSALRTLCNKPAAITSFLEGMWTRRVQPFHCAELGGALARFHGAGADFDMVRRNRLTLDAWRPLYERSRDRAIEVNAELPAVVEEELDYLEANWPAPESLPVGVCHADMFPDNVFFIGESLSGVIDFYFACTDFLAYDIAVCMNAWCFERDRSFNATKARKLLAAYSQVRRLTDAEYVALPVLARGSALRFLLTRLYDWLNCPEGALVKPHDPMEYLAYLRFHRGIVEAGAYGLD